MTQVLFIAPVYEYDPILVPALRLQAYADWQLLLIHDGPSRNGLSQQLADLDDPRIRYYETPHRHNDWGHSLRALALEQVEQEPIDAEYVVITNGDNYYAPGFLSTMLPQFTAETIAVACGMAHDHRQWMPTPPDLHFGRIDCGSLVVRREAALAVGWQSREFAADWTYISQLVTRYGEQRFKLLPNILFVHN